MSPDPAEDAVLVAAGRRRPTPQMVASGSTVDQVGRRGSRRFPAVRSGDTLSGRAGLDVAVARRPQHALAVARHRVGGVDDRDVVLACCSARSRARRRGQGSCRAPALPRCGRARARRSACRGRRRLRACRRPGPPSRRSADEPPSTTSFPTPPEPDVLGTGRDPVVAAEPVDHVVVVRAFDPSSPGVPAIWQSFVICRIASVAASTTKTPGRLAHGGAAPATASLVPSGDHATVRASRPGSV